MSQELLSVSIISGDDRTFVHYKGRRVLICPRGEHTDISTSTVSVLNGDVDGVLSIELRPGPVFSRLADGHWIYSHHLKDGDYNGYWTYLTVGFWIKELDLMQLFYPFYYKKKEGDKLNWRCPARTLDEAWEYSEKI